MNADDYLNRLGRQLKGFSPAEQQELLDEIASHIESGAEDPHLGEEPERERRVMAEMGAPEQMGRGLRGLYRPNRLTDLLWLLVSILIFQNLANFILSRVLGANQELTPADPRQYLGSRIILGMFLVFLLVGWRRRSVLLVIFWITESLGILVSLMTRDNRWIPGNELIPGTTWQGLVFYVLLAVLLVWLVRALEQNRFDLLLVTYALLPISVMAANYLTIQITMRLDSTRIGLYSVLMLIIPGLAWVAGMALLFLVQQRDVRWFSLVLIAASFALPYLTNYSAFWQVPLMFGGTIALVFIGWALDLRSRGRDHRLAE
jgi:hypothetical protein